MRAHRRVRRSWRWMAIAPITLFLAPTSASAQTNPAPPVNKPAQIPGSPSDSTVLPGGVPAIEPARDPADAASPPVKPAEAPTIAEVVPAPDVDLGLRAAIASPVGGPAALVALGTSLDAVAARNGMSAQLFTQILTTDASARIDATGRLSFVEPMAPVVVPMVESPAAAKAAGALTPQAAPFPYANTFQLHSRPGAQRTIYLDFDGHTISGTAWNANGLAAGAYAGFSIDAGAAFSNAEMDIVQSVWQRVAEDFAPFDVDVTTQDPGFAALDRAGAADVVFGTRAMISGSVPLATAVCGNGCGGVAYVGVYNHTTQHAFFQPALVFSHLLGNDAKNIAEATTHEVGHNLGLSHDGTTTGQAYYAGHNQWAPIMGVGYGRPVTQWSRGEYANANNTEDDLARIQTFGLPLRPDDHSNSVASGTALTQTSPQRGSGVLSTESDYDAFSFTTTCVGGATARAIPRTPSPNLDVWMGLYDAAGTFVTSSDPASAMVSTDVASGMDATISASLGIGTYRLLVTGVGVGANPSVGYSFYASLGQYDIEVTNCNGARPANDDFANATAVAGAAGSLSYTNDNSTGQSGEPGGSGALNTTWIRWTAPYSGPVVVDTVGSAFDTYLCAYSGTSLGALTSLGCNDDSNGGLQSSVPFNAVSGTQYRFQVDGFSSYTGSVTFNLRPANDSFANAALLSGVAASAVSSTEAATAEVSEPGGSGALNTVWWRWTAPASGLVTFDTVGSAGDTYLCVYTGNALNALTSIGCNDDGATGVASAIQTTATTGVVYYLQVDGFSTQTSEVVARARMPRCSGRVVTVDLALDGQVATVGADVILGTPANDIIAAGDGADVVCGQGGNDTIAGDAGNDVILPGTGDDVVSGGAGTDAVNYSDLSGAAGVTVALTNAAAQNTGGGGTETITQIENVTGSRNADTLTGTNLRNSLDGGAGNDSLVGLDEIDRFTGGAGTDSCNGGDGADVHVSGCETLISVP